MTYAVYNAEFVAWAKDAASRGEKFHAVLCDPPYGLYFMGKDWDNPSINADLKTGLIHNIPQGRGGKPEDREKKNNSDFQKQAESWGTALLPLLHPGALVFMFGGTRMWHRLAAGMEDAGFHLWDTLMWLYGQGFPKAQDISKLIDKANGDERSQVIGRYQPPEMDKPWNLQNAKDERIVPLSASSRNNLDIMAPASDVSAPWSGHKTPQLKPAWEPILTFRAPSDGLKYAELALKYGSGCLNVEGGRIGTSKNVPSSVSRTTGISLSESADGSLRNETGGEDGHNPNIGRYPANLVLDEESAAMLDQQTGNRKAGASVTGKEPSPPTKNAFGEYDRIPFRGYGDSGGASRFFYVTKASRSERQAGLDVKNEHPTVKPIELNRWLASLLLPPDSVKPRRLLVPFSGVGSEMIGALLVGWDEVIGIEMDATYCGLAELRIQHWAPAEPQPKKLASVEDLFR
jgi:DNA modification methylase